MSRFRLWFVFLLVVAALIVSGCFTAPEPRTDSSGIDNDYMDRYLSWYIQREMQHKDIAGLSIAVVDGNRVIWAKGFGFSNRETGEVAGPDTLYRAGSVSKLFSATAVMQLVESKHIDIDQPIVRYVPEFKIKSRFGTTDGITPRNMMSHHSGLPTMYEGDGVSLLDESFRNLLDKIKDDYVATPPNTVTAYSNLAYSLLGVLIENVSGKDFRRYMHENLLQPLSMHRAFFISDTKSNPVAQGYDHNKVVEETSSRLNPAGGLVSSVGELANLAIMAIGQGQFGEHALLRKNSFQTMLASQSDHVPLDFGKKHGLGWFAFPDSLQTHEMLYGHDGATDAHRAYLRFAPKSELGVVILSNSAQSSESLLEIGREAMGLALEMKTGIPRSPKIKSTPKLLSGGTANSNPLDGDYAGQFGLIRIYTIGEYQYLKVMGYVFSLRHGEDGKFHLLYQLWDVFPMSAPLLRNVSVQNETVSGINLLSGDDGKEKTILGVRLAKSQLSAHWTRRLGIYRIVAPTGVDAPPQQVELRYEQGHLVVRLHFITGVGSEFVLLPVNDDEAIKAGLGRGLGESVRFYDEANQVYGFFSGIKIKKID